MQIPQELWSDKDERRLVTDAAKLFEDLPIVLTDNLANSIWMNERAEELFGDSAEALVNRAAFSLLGFGSAGEAPDALAEALLGKRGPWKAFVNVETAVGPKALFCEASAICRGEDLICGILRFRPAGN